MRANVEVPVAFGDGQVRLAGVRVDSTGVIGEQVRRLVTVCVAFAQVRVNTGLQIEEFARDLVLDSLDPVEEGRLLAKRFELSFLGSERMLEHLEPLERSTSVESLQDL
jgi:hypothetical protein